MKLLKIGCAVCNGFDNQVGTIKEHRYTKKVGIFRKRYVDVYSVKPICLDCVNELIKENK